MKLFTKSKEEFSSKITGLESDKKNKTLNNEWLLSDDQFDSILHSSTVNENEYNSKIREILLKDEEEEIEG